MEAVRDVPLKDLFDRDPWPHQLQGVQDVLAHAALSMDPAVVTSPTGGGKSKIETAIVNWAAHQQWPVVLYTNRNMLLEQTMGVLDEASIRYGVRAADFRELYNPEEDVQLASMQTEISQCLKRENRQLHPARLVLIDEAHLMRTGEYERLIRDHIAAGALVIGVTATPLDINHIYKRLIIAGTKSELRECGAIVSAVVKSPDELDCSMIRPTATGEYSIGDVRKTVWTPAIFGRVYEKWKEYNPDARQALAFAPGVEESIWFAEQFQAKGVKVAHIDGENVWVDGEYYETSPQARNDVMAKWNAGEIKILWNRFVLREGINIPSAYHLILATPIGSFLSYQQTVGRILRKSEQTPDHVLITDHGGNWHRHCSPNEDVDWQSLFHIPSHLITSMRLDAMRENKKDNPEPITCPNCGLVRKSGSRCMPAPIGCGEESPRRKRIVLQHDGELKTVEGEIYRPRKRKETKDTQKVWDKYYWASRNSKSDLANTFSQLEARFRHDHGYFPPRTLKNMPLTNSDWFRKVRDIESWGVRK